MVLGLVTYILSLQVKVSIKFGGRVNVLFISFNIYSMLSESIRSSYLKCALIVSAYGVSRCIPKYSRFSKGSLFMYNWSFFLPIEYLGAYLGVPHAVF